MRQINNLLKPLFFILFIFCLIILIKILLGSSLEEIFTFESVNPNSWWISKHFFDQNELLLVLQNYKFLEEISCPVEISSDAGLGYLLTNDKVFFKK